MTDTPTLSLKTPTLPYLNEIAAAAGLDPKAPWVRATLVAWDTCSLDTETEQEIDALTDAFHGAPNEDAIDDLMDAIGDHHLRDNSLRGKKQSAARMREEAAEQGWILPPFDFELPDYDPPGELK